MVSDALVSFYRHFIILCDIPKNFDKVFCSAKNQTIHTSPASNVDGSLPATLPYPVGAIVRGGVVAVVVRMDPITLEKLSNWEDRKRYEWSDTGL